MLYGATSYLDADNSRYMKLRDGTVHRFDASGRITAIEDRNGNKIVISRQTGGRITSIKEPAGRELVFTYDALGRVSSITAPDGGTVSYQYDTQERLVQVTDQNKGVTTYTYDSQHMMLTVTDPRRIKVIENTYDEFGRVSWQGQADGGEYVCYYFSPSTPARFSQPSFGAGCGFFRGFIREGDPVPNGACGVINVGIPGKNGELPEGSTATNSINQAICIDPKGSAPTYRFDGQGYPLSMTDAMGGQTSYEREAGTNLLKSVTDKLGRTTTYTHDARGNVTSVTDPAGNVTRYEYDALFNKPTKMTDALGNVTKAAYDAKGNLIEFTTPKGEKTTISYNANGKPVSLTDALGNTTLFEYDAYWNLTKATDPLGNSVTMQYDLLSRLIAFTDPKGKTTRYAYDPMNRIAEMMDALNNKTKFTYDANGNLLTVTDAKNHTITYTYDVWDNVASMTDQLGKTEHYGYDLKRNLVAFTDRKGQQTTYSYDYLDRLTDIEYADGSSLSFSYDAGDRLTTIDDSLSGMIIRSYDILDRLTDETTSSGSLSYAYDAIGRRTGVTVAGQNAVNYEFDLNSNLTNISSNFGSSILNFEFIHDALGRRTAITRPNGVTTTYAYDKESHLLNLDHLNPLNEILEKISYVYDANGNRTKMERANVPVKLPNSFSNITYNSANQMLTFDDKTMTYDSNGNMETVTNSCGTTIYTWNARNRLVGIQGIDAQCRPLSASFKYDALGRRIEKSGTDTEHGSRETAFLYDGLNIVQEIENGMVSTNYLRTLRIDEPLTRMKSDGTVRYYQQDALGSVIALTDETGSVKTQYNYDPFGNTELIGESSDNSFQYARRENDGTGLLFERNRYYSPELYRYISQDPIGFAGRDVNFYVRVGNNPVGYTDPFGLTQKDIDTAFQLVEEKTDLAVPSKVEVKDLGSNLGETDVWTGDIAIDDGYLEELNDADAGNLLDTVVHEILHHNESIPERIWDNISDKAHSKINKQAEDISSDLYQEYNKRRKPDKCH